MITGKTIRLNVCIILTGFLVVQCTGGSTPESGDTVRTLYATEEIRIGDLEGEDEYVFGDIWYVAVGKNGEIFVADAQLPVIRMYDPEGRFIRNVGRDGRGPGEYQFIIGMKTFPDGRLAVSDPRSLIINVYDPQGEFLESFSSQNTLFGPGVFQTGHSGNFYIRRVLRHTPDMPNWEYAWLKLSQEGEIVDTIHVPLDDEDREQAFVLFTASGNAYPFIEQPLSSLSPLGYLITGRNDRYSFQLNKPGMDPVLIERDHTPVQVHPDEKAQWEAWKRRFGTSNIIPDIKPVYKDLITDSQGRIWVWRYVEAEYTEKNIGPDVGPESRWWERPTFDVYLPDGSFYATVILPWNASFREARDDKVWAVETGEFGEQYVVRYRLEE
jgi:hypothetical protein